MSHEGYFLQFSGLIPGANLNNVKCPSCGQLTCSVCVKDGVLVYVCFRASCSVRGGVPLRNHMYYADKLSVLPPLSVYYGPCEPLSDEHMADLQARFHLSSTTLRRSVKWGLGRYMLSINRPLGSVRGWVSRQPWGYPAVDTHPKTVTYKNEHEPMISWYYHSNTHDSEDWRHVILVEDQISAMRIAQDTEYKAVALLGTSLNAEKVEEIQRHASHIRVALDADATSTAFKLAREWGRAFGSCKVDILTKDVKNMTVAEVKEKFR